MNPSPNTDAMLRLLLLFIFNVDFFLLKGREKHDLLSTYV